MLGAFGNALAPELQAKGSKLLLVYVPDRAPNIGLMETQAKESLSLLTFWYCYSFSVAGGKRRQCSCGVMQSLALTTLEVSLGHCPLFPCEQGPCYPQQLRCCASQPCLMYKGWRLGIPISAMGLISSLFGELQLHVTLLPSCLFSFFTITTGSLWFVGPSKYNFVFLSFTVSLTVTFVCPFGQT